MESKDGVFGMKAFLVLLLKMLFAMDRVGKQVTVCSIRVWRWHNKISLVLVASLTSED